MTNEIVSFNHFIQSASTVNIHADYGLGYLAYMLSLNPNVDEIVIVDNNPDVISLFKEQIYPQFSHQNVKIIQCDALDF